MLMRKCQWFSVALVALCVVMPVPSWALGLGEIEVDSALNERFSGTIGLLDAEGFQPSEIVVSMASREDFDRVGVERFFYLTNIKFDVQIKGGVAEVIVTSSRPVSEPYLNFIVEVLWPNGRLLKEFTVLLDPPTFGQAAAPEVAAPSQPVAAAPAEPDAATRRADSGTQVGLRRPPAARPTERRAPPADGIMTTRDDTLWKIAERSRGDSVTINQQMLAIQRKNPEAFMRNNINLLKAGYVLELPSETEARQLENAVANADVSEQMEAWRSGTDRQRFASSDSATALIDEQGEDLRSQVDATAARQRTGSQATDAEGQVRILASTGDLASGTARGDDPTVNQLIEEKETLTRQVDELTYQLDREKEIASNQVTVKDRQLEVKDAEIAQLQEQLRLAREAVAAQAEQNQNQSPTSTPAEETPWYMSPMVLGSVIGVLILALIGVLVAGRRNRGAEEEALYIDDEGVDYEVGDDEFEQDSLAGEALQVATAVEPTIGDAGDLDDVAAVAEAEDEDEHENLHEGEDEIVALYEEEEQAAEVDASEDSEETKTGDVIGEAEIYIAYGRYGQAANLLAGVLANEPDRWDVRLKLLEACVESHDMDTFTVNAQYIVDNCEEEDVLLACRELEAQMGDAHVDLSNDAADEPSGTVPQETSAAADADEDDFDLDLDDLAVESPVSDAVDTPLDEISDDAASPAVAEGLGAAENLLEEVAENAGEDEFELEFDTELDGDADDAGTKSSGADELGGDLGFDFDPDRDVADEASADATSTATEADAAADEVEIDLDDLELEADALSDVADTAEEDAQSDTAVPDLSASTDGAVDGNDDAMEDFEFDTEADADINATKLDLAEAYVDMGDADGAQDILNEVLEEGTPEQQEKAKAMLDSMAG